MLKPPPPTKKPQAKAKKPQAKAKSQPKAQSSDDDKDSELHKYAAPGEHIEIPAWKRSGLVMKVENAHYGPEGGRRYLVSHHPDDEKGSWYQLEPHHFHNNDNPDHHKVAQEYVHRESAKAMSAAADAAENKTHGTKSDEYRSATRRMREMHDATRTLQARESASDKRELPPPPPLKSRK